MQQQVERTDSNPTIQKESDQALAAWPRHRMRTLALCEEFSRAPTWLPALHRLLRLARMDAEAKKIKDTFVV